MTDKYVVAGVWADTRWHDAASSRNTSTADAGTMHLFSLGPRIHPYGPHAFSVIVDREHRVYPTKEAAMEDPAVAELVKADSEAAEKAASVEESHTDATQREDEGNTVHEAES